ncbi:MAG: GAF domain-containing protein, partial [Rhodospirillaceae bacterium]|nr:GAF domain-containing protein [Rhodospirillaceae bacterium]
NRLMETILQEARDICHADAGTLYLRDGEQLKFEIMLNSTLPNLNAGGTTGKEITLPPISLHDEKTGEANHKNVASHVALTGETINIPDAYETEKFDFTGTKRFDAANKYRSTSFLTVPMTNHEGDVIGVLQLLNATDPDSDQVTSFSVDVQPLVEALTSQAAVALDNQNLIEAQKKLLDSFIAMIAGAIDAKSPYTGGHCQRVPKLAMMLADAACESSDGIFTDFDLNEEERYELEIAALLHDCGKVTTPEYVVDKATKLETIYDRIHEVRTRFEVLKRDAEIECLKGIVDGGDEAALKQILDDRLAQLDEDFVFLAKANIGGEFFSDEDLERVQKIATETWVRTLDDRIGVSHEELKRMEAEPAKTLPAVEPLLADRPEHIIVRDAANKISPDNPLGFKMNEPEHMYNRGELYNLTIRKGTLSQEERYKINHHMVQTVTMLEQLPFPKHLKQVPEYAGSHHETMIGTGYPRKLSKEDMTLPARMMAIADIFEALTACDRPYKKAKSLSESVRILSFMKKDEHVDPDLFDLFLKSGVFRDYAEKFLQADQIDDVDISQYLDGDDG